MTNEQPQPTTTQAEGLEGAYAEKPFQDAVIQYEKELSEPGRQALRLIAEREGEKAIQAYRESRNLEDPRIDALRFLASQTVIITGENSKFIREDSKLGDKPSHLEALVKRLGLGVVDQVITDENIEFPQKFERIRRLGFALNSGIITALKPRTDISELVMKGCNKFNKGGGWSAALTHDILLGYFATATLRGNSVEGIEALAQLAKVEDRLPRDVIQKYVPLIVELRNDYPEIN